MAFLKSLFGTKEPKTCPVCGQENPANAKFCSNCSSEFPDVHDHYDAFISYRRESGSDLASLIKSQLESRFHKKVFLDIKELQVGKFDEKLLLRIEETANFILILSKASLDRCVNKSDWLKREIMHALKTGRNIIPVFTEGFVFPTDEVWALLPPEMHRDLPAFNGVTYSHIYQDDAIRKIASYMKTDAEVSPWQDAGNREESQPPPPIGSSPARGTEKQSAPLGKHETPPQAGKTEVQPPNTKVEAAPDVVTPPLPAMPEKTSGVRTTAQVIEEQKDTRQQLPDESVREPYAPIIGLLLRDLRGSETMLNEFGIIFSTSSRVEKSCLVIERGSGSRAMYWDQIKSVIVQGEDGSSIMLRDGRSLNHIKLRPGHLVGTDEEGFHYDFKLEELRAIEPLRDTTIPEREALIRDIPILARRQDPGWSFPSTFELKPDNDGIVITVNGVFMLGTHSFRLPGPYEFSAEDRNVKVMADKQFTLGGYDYGDARILANALNRLNALLAKEQADAAGESESQQELATRLDVTRIQPQTNVQEPLPRAVPVQDSPTGSSHLPEPSEPKQELSLDLSPFTKQTDGSWAFMSGIWALIFCPEPGVTSEVRISPGAAFQVLKTIQFQDKKWTNIRLEDGREGWLTGEPGASLVVGAILQAFSIIDPRTFFVTAHESLPRVGFLLADIALGYNATTGGSLESFKFADASWGPVSISISHIQKIEIDRQQKDAPKVKIQTDSQKYVGEFPSTPGHLNLILTKPFVGLNNMKSELEMNRILDLNTVEYAELKRIPNPHQI